MTDRPNFVLFITDQHRADFLGCYGHPVLRTPNIDRIARNGVRFDRFYVSNPQCMPNRATLMTGRMPSIHGVRTNGIPLPLRSNTFVDLLRVSGYATTLVGKSHLQTMFDASPDGLPADFLARRRGPDRAYAEARRPVGDEDYDQEQTGRWTYYAQQRPLSGYYGFEHVDLCTMHGDMGGGDYWLWLKARHAQPETLRGPANQLPHDYVCPQAWRTAVPEELYPTRYIEEKSVEWLERHARGWNRKPFFMQVSFPDPHHPFTPPGRYWGMYDPDDMVLPASFDATDDPPPHLALSRATARQSGNEYHAFPVNAREAREAMALTCGMTAMIDDAVGTVLRTLDRLGLSDDTVVMFTSDHGDLLGDHAMMLKGPFHFQGLVRVPFVWADVPGRGRAGVATDALSGTIDIGQTVLDRAGIAPFNGAQGRSLLPLADGRAAERRDAFVVEEEQHAGVLGFDRPMRLRTIITDRYRMTVYRGVEWGELYDLADDPAETRNMWDSHNAREIRHELMARLAYELIDTADDSPLPTRLG
jgi:arylsulfatase A-like enzyme